MESRSTRGACTQAFPCTSVNCVCPANFTFTFLIGSPREVTVIWKSSPSLIVYIVSISKEAGFPLP